MTATAFALAIGCRTPSRGASDEAGGAAPIGVRGSGPLTIVAVGDVVAVDPWPARGVDRGFDTLVDRLQQAGVAIAELEQTLSDRQPSVHTSWPVGSPTTAADLRRAGFTVVTRATNHSAGDNGEEIASTGRALDRAGLHHAGAGPDLDAARAPVILGSPPRRVAVLAVATSASDAARAAPKRGEIAGRPGVSAITVEADVTAEPATYATLSRMAQTTGTGRETPEGLQLAGRLVRKGTRTSVVTTLNPLDVGDVLKAIDAARAAADVVSVSVHSHEPVNLSTEPAGFLRDFARQAIDHGARLVIGNGPRQLRGIELYHGGAILYSLGNFAFDAAKIPAAAADVYDANTDLDAAALGALGQRAMPTLPAYDGPEWWESVVATATFDGSRLVGLRLDPIDLGVDRPREARGLPRQATGPRAGEILNRLATLSNAFGTTIHVVDGAGEVMVP